MSKTYDIMVAGHVCLDLIPEFLNKQLKPVQEILRPGTLVNMGECAISTGGPVSNTAIGLQILGHQVCFCASIGDDHFGKVTFDLLQKRGSTEGIKITTGRTSSYTIALAPPDIDRIFLHYTGPNNEFSAKDLNPALIAECRHFHFGYPPLMRTGYENEGAELKRIFQIAKKAGAITSCDMALPDPHSTSGRARWDKILENILPYIDLYLPSLEETFFMLEPKSYLRKKKKTQGSDLIYHMDIAEYSRLSDKLIHLGAKMVALKAGEKGFYFRTADLQSLKNIGDGKTLDLVSWSNRELFCPAFIAPSVASATGSGDSSIAGFLSAFLRKYPLETCLKYACLVGWENVQELDAVSGIKSWAETQKIFEQGVPIHHIKWKSNEWIWNDRHQLWAGPKDPLGVND
jgi:sugar/nucleoside kinase (ribokinase family)